MSKYLRLIQIFISSPSDVADEREIIEEVVNELNVTFLEHDGVYLKPLRWETEAYPGFSNEGAQGVISQQISDDYEIFIAVFWQRFGTPTSEASSGTEHEFAQAYARWKEDPNSVQIMIYFKQEGILPDEIDVEQIILIKDFKEKIKSKGLYWEFVGHDEFKRYLRLHITKAVKKLIGSKESELHKVEENIPEIVNESIAISDLEEEDIGFLDAVEKGIESIGQASELLNRVTDITNLLGEQTNRHTEQLNSVDSEGEAATRDYKKIINSMAEKLSDYGEELSEITPNYKRTMGDGLNYYSQMVTVLEDFQSDDTTHFESVHASLVGIIEAIDNAYPNIEGLRDSIKAVPRMTSKFNRAKRQAAAAIDDFLVEQIRTQAMTSDIVQLVEDMINKDE